MKLLNNTTSKIMFISFIFVFASTQSFAQMHLIRTIHHEADSKYLEPPYSLQSLINGFDVSPDSKYLATSGTSDDIRIWDISSGELIRSINNVGSSNTPLRFMPDLTRIAAGGSGGIVKVFNIQTGEVEQILEQKPEPLETPNVIEMAISPDSNKLAMRVGDAVTIWDLNTGERLAFFDLFPGYVVNFFSDNIRLFIDGSDKALFFNTENGMIERTIDGFNPQLLYDEKHVVYQNETVLNPGLPNQELLTSFVTYNLKTNQIENETANFNFNLSPRARVSPSGKTMVLFNPESELKETCLFQMATLTKARTFQTPEIDYFSWYKYSPDGRMLVTTKEDKVYLWDISDLDSKIKSPGIFNN